MNKNLLLAGGALLAGLVVGASLFGGDDKKAFTAGELQACKDVLPFLAPPELALKCVVGKGGKVHVESDMIPELKLYLNGKPVQD